MPDESGGRKTGWKREGQELPAGPEEPGSMAGMSRHCSHTVTRPILDLGIKTCEECGRVLGFIERA